MSEKPGTSAGLILKPGLSKPQSGSTAEIILGNPAFGNNWASADAQGASDSAEASASFSLVFSVQADATGANDAAEATASQVLVFAAMGNADGASDSAESAVEYDAAIDLVDSIGLQAAWRQGEVKESAKIPAWRQSQRLDKFQPTVFRDGLALESAKTLRFTAAEASEQATRAFWRDSLNAENGIKVRLKPSESAEKAIKPAWRQGLDDAKAEGFIYLSARLAEIAKVPAWRDGLGLSAKTGFLFPVAVLVESASYPYWFDGYHLGEGWPGLPVPGRKYAATLIYPVPILGFLVPRPKLRSILLRHDISVVILPSGQPIPCSGFSVSYDIVSQSYQFSLRIHSQAALDLVKHDNDGQPKMLELAVDGDTFVMLCEDYPRTIGHGIRSIEVKGRSLSALLSKPYYTEAAVLNSSTRTASQLVSDQLPLSGWSVDWVAATDWSIPPGKLNLTSATPLGAMAAVTDAAGLVLRPSRNAQAFEVIDPYQIPPWQTGQTIIQIEKFNELSDGATPPPAFNAVYVHGDEGGVMGHVLITGTSADQVADSLFNPLITHTDAARSRGRRLLSESYGQALRALTIPLGGPWPLITAGDWVAVMGKKAVVRAWQMNCELSTGKVRQQLTFDQSADNLSLRLNRLLPSQPKLYGEVVSVDGTTVKVLLPKGGHINAKPAGFSLATGDHVYVQSGIVVSTASAFSAAVDLEI